MTGVIRALVLVALAVAASHAAGEKPFTNAAGVTRADLRPAPDFLGVGRRAGMSVNPGGAGQILFAPYYDVRVARGAGGSTDVRQTYVTLRNRNPADPSSPDYDPYGGILFRFSVQESQFGVLSTTFPVVLGCGESWSAVLYRGAEGLPYIRSMAPIVSSASGSFGIGFELRTAPQLSGRDGVPLRLLESLSPGTVQESDLQRGAIAIYAIAAVPCTPADPPVSQRGNVWVGGGFSSSRPPPTSLTGDVSVVRIASGLAHTYEMTPVARYQELGPSVNLPVIFDNDVPAISNCLGFDSQNVPYSSLGCTRQANLAFSKSRLRVPFDVADGRSTRLVIHQVTRRRNCNVTPNGTPFRSYPQTSYTCSGLGEPMAVSLQSHRGKVKLRRNLRLPRTTSLIALGPTRDREADLWINTKNLQSGVLEIDLARNRRGKVLHREFAPSLGQINFLGASYQGYEGLPVIALGLSERSPGVGGTGAFEPVQDVSYLTE